MRRNLILDMDAYKSVHWKMLHPGIQGGQVYGGSRKGGEHEYVYFSGLSHIVSEYFDCPTQEDLDEAVESSIATFGYNTINVEVWEKVIELGYIPVVIKGLPEGTRAPIGTPMFTMEPTEDWFLPVMNGLETILMGIWYPSTLMTRLANIQAEVNEIYEETGTPGLAEFAVNDFSARSGMSREASDIAGMVHLMISKGSDNMHSQRLINKVFGKKGNHRIFSVWATEHAVALSYGPGEGEYDYIKAQLETNKTALKSIVGDTYDYKHFVEVIMRRPDVQKLIDEHPGRIMIRPDSGDFFDNVSWTLRKLEEQYGSCVNDKGYKVINKNIGVIQGDGMNEKTIIQLYNHIIYDGWSADNIVVGAGTGIMFEGLTRDTNRFAVKPSFYIIDNQMVNTIKNPKTDPSKKSLGGDLNVTPDLKTVSSMDFPDTDQGSMDFINTPCIMECYYFGGYDSVVSKQKLHKIIKRVKDGISASQKKLRN